MSSSDIKSDKKSTYDIPLGPVHVALEEPVYFHLTVENETIRKIHLTSGHVHRGMEALAAQRNIFKNITLCERVCSLCSNTHSFAYCMVVEKCLEMSVSMRARYLRVLAEEIKRVASHLFNIAIQTHIIGFKSLFMHIMEVREMMQDIKETVYGNRMNLAANCIGGVKYDINPELIQFILAKLLKVESACIEIIEIYESNSLVIGRTKGVGILPTKDAIELGVVGPVARGSGIYMDVRKDAPYSAYPELEFNVIVENGACSYARAMVRLREILESISLIRQCCANVPEGALVSPIKEIVAMQACVRTEAPRGEVIYYIRTNSTDIPVRLKWRVPSYMNWEALVVMMQDCQVADVALIANSIDPCVSCTER